jgi:hypothetical protein
VKEVFIDLMIERVMYETVMYVGVQASSMTGVQASLSTARRSGPSRVVTENITKHRDDLVNAKLILTILPDYIPPLVGAVSRDSALRDFDYTMVIAYLPKGICIVRAQ